MMRDEAFATVALTETSSKVPGSSAQNEASSAPLAFKDVFAAIGSLYVDELKPFGRILRKRVAERALQQNLENQFDVDTKNLRTMCEEAVSLRVEPEEGGDWSALILGRSDTFVDVYSSVDVYPEGMWGAAAAYLQGLSGDEMYLPGGRYACAQALEARNLDFLHGRTLGQICHIVQLAISQRKLLGYLNGAVVPYAFSQSMLKEQCALLKAPCTALSKTSNMPGLSGESGVSQSGLPIATWETARQYLSDILCTPSRSVPLSNIKRLFRSRFHTELSETKLGHSKLSDLLQDERFSDICIVQLEGNGYIVSQVQSQKGPDTELLSDSLLVHGNDLLGSPCDIDFCSLVQRTFIHASPPPPTPPPNVRRRSASLPKDVGSEKGLWESEDTASIHGTGSTYDESEASQSHTSSESSRPCLDDPIKVLLREMTFDKAETHDLDNAEEDKPGHRLQLCINEPLMLEEADVFIDTAPLTQTPSGMYSHPSAPRWPWTSSLDGNEPLRAPLFCPDEPLALGDCGLFIDTAALAETPTSIYEPAASCKWPCVSPSIVQDSCVGSIALSKVHNTFIHSPLPPVTPLGVGALRRSRSLPKNVGSDKNIWEATCRSLGCRHIPHLQPSQQKSSTVGPYVTTSNGFSDCIPPSPALTASPIQRCAGGLCQFEANTYHYDSGHALVSAMETEYLMSHYAWPACSFHTPDVVPISLASLLH
jgi:hypothetical protein